MLQRLIYFLLFSVSLFTVANGQSGYIQGHVIDEKGQPVEFVNIGVKEFPTLGTTSNKKGDYFIKIPFRNKVTLVFTYIGFKSVQQKLFLKKDDTVQVDITIYRTTESLETVVVTAKERKEPSTFTLEPIKLETIPLPSGNFENLLKTIGLGVGTAGGELSSQYSVRGGSFDENLVYINDFEIYRPLLPRSGQQEGLSFLNPDMVSRIKFSSGGFEAKYGDKLSSVLDADYRRPDDFGAVVSLSMLGINLLAEDKIGNFSYQVGFRQKQNQYLLNSLNTKGTYKPSFTDVQGVLNWKLSSHWETEFLGNYSRNQYRFVPESRVTSIGTINNVKQLEVFFDGQEIDWFNTMFGGLSATYIGDSNRLRLKFLTSAYTSDETETYDIIGDYFLYQVENDLGSKNFGERLFSLGYGTNQRFARNYLNAFVFNAGHKGFFYTDKHLLEWGARYQREIIDDQLNEWFRIDSALYSLPYDTGVVQINSVLKTNIALNSNRYSAYFQDTWVLDKDSVRDMNITIGARIQYWDVNKETLISPRIQFSIKPNVKKSMILKASLGLYQQAPFYRELRDLEGNLNKDVLAQKSIHAVLGSDFIFKAWGRDFRLISEAYYKYMWDLVPYNVEDVKIRYFGKNMAKGYAAGLDFRINGEFVDGAESYISLGIMKTQENLEGDYFIDENGNKQEVGYIARPTDQRVTVGILFQDYLPKSKNFWMSLNMLFGTGLPFSPPVGDQYRNTFRMPTYRRVDIGFSYTIHDEERIVKPGSFISNFKSLWVSLEVFNLLDIQNTISHIWIKDNRNVYYAFENHLTGRLINLKVTARF
jgi:carboxypeptidase-like protein/TonB-dependent receptor-like protein